jgi:hypothetical protein
VQLVTENVHHRNLTSITLEIHPIQEQCTMIYQFNSTRNEAAAAIGISPKTLRKWEQRGKISSHVYTRMGYKTVRYCIPLLTDWQIDPDDIEAQCRAIEALNATRPSQHPRKAGRKANAA